MAIPAPRALLHLNTCEIASDPTGRSEMGNSYHLRKLREGPKAWNRWRCANPGVVPDLNDAVFPLGERQWGPVKGGPIDLSGTELCRAALQSATLVEASLADAALNESDLSHASLEGADLSGADLSRAILAYADLRDADLTMAVLDGAQLQT